MLSLLDGQLSHLDDLSIFTLRKVQNGLEGMSDKNLKNIYGAIKISFEIGFKVADVELFSSLQASKRSSAPRFGL